eukprot:jgi/Psemu1/293632/fgenesh1_pg.3036_\
MACENSSVGDLPDPREGEGIVLMDERQTSDDSCVAENNNRTAILLLDFQNEYVKKGGKLHHDVGETINSTGVLRNVPRLVEHARKMGALIIYSPVVMKETGRFNEVKDEGSDSSLTEDYEKLEGLFTEGTWNCEIIHEVQPRNDDIILTDRNDFSAFGGTKLLSCLKENNVHHFFVAGFLTDVCVYQTSMDAAIQLPDMITYVVSDGCAANTMDDHNTALEKIAEKSVKVVSSSDAESIFRECATSMKNRVLDGSDEWLVIDKIFSAGGVGANEKISVTKLQSLIESLPWSSSISSTLSEKVQGAASRMSRQDMHRILFQRKPRSGLLEKLPIFLVMIYMPFVYTISTRLPFIFIALEITVARGRGLLEVGLVLGVYQSSRAFGNLSIVALGGKDPFKRLQIFLILLALSGWLFLAFYGRDTDTGTTNDQSDILPLFALFWVGLCETIVILQRSLMTETANESPSGIMDEKILTNRFSFQYSMVALGSSVAFVLGGWLYTEYGYFAVCDFGISVQIAHLIGAISYLCLTRKRKKDVKGNKLEGNDLIRSVIYQFQSVSVIAKYARDIANGPENALNSEPVGLSAAVAKSRSDRVLNHSLGEMFDHFFIGKRDNVLSMEELLNSIDKAGTGVSMASRRPMMMAVGKNKLAKLVLFLMKSKEESTLTKAGFVSFWAPRVYLSMFESSQAATVSVIWPYMRAIVLTQAVAALCIGTFLSTALLSYTVRFDIDAARVGLLLGVGEGLSVLTMCSRSFSNGRNAKKSGIMGVISSRPLHVPFVLLLTSLCSMLFSIDNFIVAVICQMLFSSTNDLSVTLMNELTGTSLPADKFKFYQGIGQWLRRLSNVVTAVLGPIFFGIDEKFPFIFFGKFPALKTDPEGVTSY